MFDGFNVLLKPLVAKSLKLRKSGQRKAVWATATSKVVRSEREESGNTILWRLAETNKWCRSPAAHKCEQVEQEVVPPSVGSAGRK